MIKRLFYIVFFIGLISLMGRDVELYAGSPLLVSYQGVLTDRTGAAVIGSKTITFRLYSVPSGGTAIWTETMTVMIQNGSFSVLLGSITPLNSDLFNGTSRYLGVQVGSDPEISPRVQSASVPFSMSAGNMPRVTFKSDFPDSRYSPTSWGIYTSPGDTWDPSGLRKLTFIKVFNSSLLRITYQDTLGYRGNYFNGCKWRIYLDGTTYAEISASDTDTYGSFNVWHMENAARTVMIPNITSGSHTVTIGVIKNSTATSCLAGWNSLGEYIAVEEFF